MAEIPSVCKIVLGQVLGGKELNAPVAARELAELYTKLHENPAYQLNSKEIKFIHTHGYEGNLRAFRESEGIRRELKLFISAYEKVRELKNRDGRSFRKLTERILRDPKASLTENESSMIQRSGLESQISLLRKISNSHGPWIRGLTALAHARRSAFLAILLGVTATDLVFEETVNDPHRQPQPLGAEEFELIYYSPLPHSDIRIGDTIYSFSTGDIKRMSFEQRQKTATPSLYGSSRRIRLKPGKSDVKALKTFLDGQVGQKYLWVPPYYSCVSATHEAIRECTHINIPPPGMDRSPAMTEAWLKLAKLTGDSKVEGVRFHSRENLALEKLKESSVNLTDTLFFLTFLPDAYVAAQLKNFNKSRAKKL